jgi:hypothetical protein
MEEFDLYSDRNRLRNCSSNLAIFWGLTISGGKYIPLPVVTRSFDLWQEEFAGIFLIAVLWLRR